jgi:pyrroloquinoline-quinone-dependent sugar dehydrogenase TrAA12-like protein
VLTNPRRDRDVPDGYRLSRIDFAEGQPVAPQDGREHENKIMWNPDNTVCPNKCFRPVAIAIDKKGRILLSSDQSGEIFLITTPDSI